ncbi:IS66 family insertion sequence element accessory protein TnpB [Enterocloster clostridioformis]|uniref:IS66 Orf2 family protein n=1 Tax=Enterocloster clostridioformis TaxID=1531 RepID=A0A2X2URJ6_9FIRM|nr:IS66 family insertion sequence element accessory protein TnpB [Enterocloster clostridioformis]MCA5577005.1 IS66 family insertion sequence element accessory protein TnpB [Enterocloster clostridioformis]SQB16211.1 IS66 Orf2 family protein [Enterocloster clostridioformis]
MRKQLDGLVDIIQYSFQLDPYSNSLFLFCGKRADRIEAVHYEGDGFCLFYKRYENGRLQWPRTGEEARQISHQQLRWLLVGLNPEQPKAVRSWVPPKHWFSLIQRGEMVIFIIAIRWLPLVI